MFLKIWIFNHYAVGPNSSGITRHYDLSKELVKLGYKVSIFASSFNHQKREEKVKYRYSDYYKLDTYSGVNFFWIKTPSYKRNNIKRIFNMFSYTKKVNKIVKAQTEKPDIIIGSLMHPLAAILGYKVAKRLNVKFYFEERDLWPQSLIDLGKVSPKNPVVKMLSKLELFLYQKANKIIVLFDKAPQYVQNRGVSTKKIIYLPNGVDLNRYQNSVQLPIEHKNLLENLKEEGKFIILYTGAHSLANYLESMLDIATGINEKINNIHFVLVGDGPEKKTLQNRVEDEKIHNISFLPAVDKEHIPTILSYADAGMITMLDAEVYKWGISLNKMYDYMAASLPIFMLANLEDSIIERNNLGIIKKNKFDLINNILIEYKDKSKLMMYGKNAYEYVQTNNSWTALAKKLDSYMQSEDLIKEGNNEFK